MSQYFEVLIKITSLGKIKAPEVNSDLNTRNWVSFHKK